MTYAMIIYIQPDRFTSVERATFEHGTREEQLRVLTTICMRGLGIPSKLK